MLINKYIEGKITNIQIFEDLFRYTNYIFKALFRYTSRYLDKDLFRYFLSSPNI